MCCQPSLGYICAWSGGLAEILFLVSSCSSFHLPGLMERPEQHLKVCEHELVPPSGCTMFSSIDIRASPNPSPPHWPNASLPYRSKRKGLGEGLQSKYVGGSTAYLLHGTRQWNERIKSIRGRAGAKVGQPLLAVWPQVCYLPSLNLISTYTVGLPPS